jgi:DNA-binding winged helix-turn-helix (wHTH) protein/tetratricopeptide (TPR) repeat protein
VSAPEKSVYRFAEFELDPRERRLLAGGAPVTLTPKVFETLVLLVERAGHAVSKDELMSALWPRGFVHESNLTKHIWLIRKALGDTEDAARFIETLPKLGYRFIAPVHCGSANGDAQQPAPPAAPTPMTGVLAEAERVALVESAANIDRAPAAHDVRVPSWRRRNIGVASIVLALVAIGVFVGWRSQSPQPPTTPARGLALAIVDFNNLSQNPKDAWLGPALGEMLATEAALGTDLHALPDELVRAARVDLKAPLAGGYSPQSLASLRRRLAADYVLSGSYLVSGSGDEAKLRVDLALQDARDGSALANFTRSASVAELPTLVTAAGISLRDRLGVAPPSTADLAATASAQPPSAEVARRIGFALDALHRYDPARARDEVLGAVAQAPDYAPAYSYLAQAWSALGYKAKALAAARQATAHEQGLPEAQRLEIEAQLHKAEFDWPAAIATLRRLCVSVPRNPEYRLQLIDALLAAGKPDDVAVVQKELAAIATEGDPRIELAAARAATAHNDPKSSQEHAANALRQAQARDDTGLIADAQMQMALDWNAATMTASETGFRAALADYQRIGNPHGEAYARQNLANLLWDGGKSQPAREEYQRAMATYQRIGDQNGVAAIYSNLCRVLWAAGDRDAALAAAQSALDLRRETGDLQGQAWNLTALATINSDESAGDDVVALYRQAIALDEQAGDRGHHVFVLSTLTDILRLRGELDEAQRTCEQSQNEARALADASIENDALFQCAQVALERGDVERAATQFAQAEAASKAAANNQMPANAEMSLGAIDLGRRDWASARVHLQRAIDGWVQADIPTGEAVAQSQLALCEDALGNAAARDSAAARARQLRDGINERGEMVEVDIALAQLRGEAGERKAAIATLHDLAADARSRDWLTSSVDAQLAEYALLSANADGAQAIGLADDIDAVAQGHGLKWALVRLQAMNASLRPVGAPVDRSAASP